MNHISVRTFARMYDGLELLSHTNESLQLGDLFDKRGMFNNILDFNGFNISYQIGLSEPEAKDLKARLASVPLWNGSFLDIRIHDRFSARGDMKIPAAQINLTGKVEQKNVKHFEIGKIQTRLLRDDLRYLLQTDIRDFHNRYPEQFRDELSRLYLIEQLFYAAEIRITFDRDTVIDLDQHIDRKTGAAELKTGLNQEQVLTIKGSNYPFAVDLKQIINFI